MPDSSPSRAYAHTSPWRVLINRVRHGADGASRLKAHGARSSGIATGKIRFMYGAMFITIAVMVTASWATGHWMVTNQQNRSAVINLATEQTALTYRIVHHAGRMAMTDSPDEFEISRRQLGVAMHRLASNHKALIAGNPDKNIPYLSNAMLEYMYFDPRVGLDDKLQMFLANAQAVYETPYGAPLADTGQYISLQVAGAYTLPPDFAVTEEEYERIVEQGIVDVINMDTVLWLAILGVLAMQILMIFRPYEQQLFKVLNQLGRKNWELKFKVEELKEARGALRAANASLQKQNTDLAHLAECLKTSNDTKDTFLSSMSHELRTPLNAVIGFGQLMQIDVKDPLSDAQNERLKNILTSGEHLLALITDILNLVQVQSESLDLEPELLNVRALCDTCLTFVEPQALGQNLTLENTVPEDLVIEADPKRLRQVLLNFVSNAVKYNTEGGQVTLDARREDDHALTILVRDTGPGIAAENLDKLFEPFNRLGREAMTVAGAGIGLTIARDLAKAMGGTIGVESTEGEGSTFWVKLPRFGPAAA